MLTQKIIFFVTLLIVVSTMGYLFLPSVNAAPVVQTIPTTFMDLSQNNIKTATQLQVNSLKTYNSQDIVSVDQTLTKDENIFQEISSFKEKIDSYAMQPGWTLVKYDQYDIMPTTGPKPLPAKHQRETWSHFNENQQVYEEVEYATSPELGTVLLGYFVKGETVSVWNDEIRQQQQPYTPSYDLYLASSVKSLLDSKVLFELNSHESALSEKAVKVIELRIQFSDDDRKWLNIKFDKQVWGTYEVFYFAPDTGMLLRYEYSYILDDMSLIPVAITDNFQIVSNAEPPANVIKLLETWGK